MIHYTPVVKNGKPCINRSLNGKIIHQRRIFSIAMITRRVSLETLRSKDTRACRKKIVSVLSCASFFLQPFNFPGYWTTTNANTQSVLHTYKYIYIYIHMYIYTQIKKIHNYIYIHINISIYTPYYTIMYICMPVVPMYTYMYKCISKHPN